MTIIHLLNSLKFILHLKAKQFFFKVNENITPNGIFSIEGLDPSTNYNIMVKCFNSAGMTPTIYTASTLTAYGGVFFKILCCKPF